MTEYEERRIAMVESQLRPNEITDRALLTVMRKLDTRKNLALFERL